MTLSELCIERPVMTTLLMAGLVLFGFFAYRNLPVSELPNVDFPTITVTANLPGASPETMAAAVATPLEKQFSTISGLDSMNSTSGQGITLITLQFALDRNIDGAALDVQTAISAASSTLPPELPTPPTFRKVNPADFPIFYLTMTSETLPLSTVDEYAENQLAQRLSTINGVAQVQVYGSQKYAVRIQVDPDQLAARGIGINELDQAIQNANVNLPTGTLSGPHQAMTINANGQLFDAAAYRPVIIAYRNGAPVHLGEVAHVIDAVENDKIASWVNDKRAIILAIQRQPGSNTVATVDAIKQALPAFLAKLPPSVKLSVLYDRSTSIRNSISDVQSTLLLAAVLVVLVIFMFLRNASATVIPSLALPISIVGTFAAMYGFGFSLDNLSLLALTLSVGFVIDDAIVMLENIMRHVEQGESPRAAAIAGSREISFTIISMTLSLAAVFIPILFMGGIVGRLLHEFAVVICVTIVVSGFVSLTLTPMLASRFVRPPGAVRHGRLYLTLERWFDAMFHAYEGSLKWALGHQPFVLGVFFMTLAGTAFLYYVVPKGFLPSEDNGQIFAFTEAAQDISFDSMVQHQQAAARIVGQDPNVLSTMSVVGASGTRTTLNNGIILLRLKPRADRALSADKVIQELRPKFLGLPGFRVYMQNPPPIRIGGLLTKAAYQYTLQDTDLEELYKWAGVLEQRLHGLPGFRDVTSDLEINGPSVQIDIDRAKAATLGVTAQQIEDALSSSFGARQISTIYTSSNEYQVILELEPRFQADPATLSRLYIRSSNGILVPLEAVANVHRGVQPLAINHQGQLPSVTLSFNLDLTTSLGQAVDSLRALTRELRLPTSLTASLQGTAQAFTASLQGLGLLVLLAVLVVYIVLGTLYESFVHPLTILSGLPSAGLGALLILWVTGIEMSLYAFVGIIMLIGIVKKNAIMMIDFALERERKHGKSPVEAIYEACLIRFRPIMMTTLAALMGTLPIAVATGQGAESRRPLGITVVGGLLVSQFLTLYITPVIYLYLDKLQNRWFAGRKIASGTD